MQANLKSLAYLGAMLLMMVLCSMSMYRCSQAETKYNNNIKALTDTISYYKSKNGDLVASKASFESTINDLRMLNEDLYNEIDDMRLKNKAQSALSFSGVIEIEKRDTAYIVEHDTIYKGFVKPFDFSDEWRELAGNVNYSNDSLKVNIDKDITHFKYTAVLGKDNILRIKSENPYVKYEEMTGFTLQKEKKKHFIVGPTAGFEYDFNDNKIHPYVGVGVVYNLFGF